VGYETTAGGVMSLSTGYNTKASGQYSLSAGSSSNARGDACFSTGQFTNSTGLAAFTTGGSTIASGSYFFATGGKPIVKARGGFTAGLWNDIADAPDAGISTSGDRIFQVGNGNFNASINVLTILKNGQIGIGTPSSFAALNVKDRSVLFAGASALPPTPTVVELPVTDAGTRMMWFPELSVFRAGHISGDQWQAKPGHLSFASGGDNEAAGEY